ncbi:hypothetical protein GCM10010347_48460 [Streptomyces cirratus]|uniref:Uncharacterized protein n=1 Tax=Streptomyces cirratus TaxID=68187 RepID=A0ABQ3EXU2_9ACTN|nr:hypothetical protein GCM10010347_48460 [Streptomyces cirratus]
MTPISAFAIPVTLAGHAQGPAAQVGAAGPYGMRTGQAAEVELLLVVDEVDDEAAGAAGADVVDEAGFEAGVLLDDAPRLSFR